MERVAYLRKVYGLLAVSMVFAIVAGFLSITVGPTETFTYRGSPVEVPIIVATMLNNHVLMFAAFGALFAATFIASWVSKVKVLNVIALFFVAALMGLELAPMAFVAQVIGEAGDALTPAPVRDAFLMTGAVFAAATAYVFITRKDFSYLRAILSMGVAVVFVACLLTFVFHSEIFSLAVASVGALLSIGMILYVTSYIFRNSDMDDPVGDALALLVQLRNLFMFLLRIFMSSRD
jgi:modulator of FtsH protease